jgi:hypothetical protein
MVLNEAELKGLYTPVKNTKIRRDFFVFNPGRNHGKKEKPQNFDVHKHFCCNDCCYSGDYLFNI